MRIGRTTAYAYVGYPSLPSIGTLLCVSREPTDSRMYLVFACIVFSRVLVHAFKITPLPRGMCRFDVISVHANGSCA